MNRTRPLPEGAEERLARYRSGAMNPDDRAAFEREVLADEALAEALYGEIALDHVHHEATRSPGAGRVPLPLTTRTRHLPVHILLPIAATLLLVSGVVLWRRNTPAPAGDWVRGERSVRALEPNGALTAPPERFRWTNEPGATSYRVELYEVDTGAPIGSIVTRDTVVAFTEVTKQQGITGASWRVTPIGPDGLDRKPASGATYYVTGR